MCVSWWRTAAWLGFLNWTVRVSIVLLMSNDLPGTTDWLCEAQLHEAHLLSQADHWHINCAMITYIIKVCMSASRLFQQLCIATVSLATCHPVLAWGWYAL